MSCLSGVVFTETERRIASYFSLTYKERSTHAYNIRIYCAQLEKDLWRKLYSYVKIY
jgi:hypothetical protein